MAKIILFGGSFDPIHHGHFLMAKNAQAAINADRVVFIPAKNPRWKPPKPNADHRYQMLNLYLADVSWAEVSRLELDGDAPVNYSIDTINAFASTHPGDQLYWLLGADQVEQFPAWQQPQAIAQAVQLLVYARPDYPLNQATIARYHMQVIAGEVSNATSSLIRDCRQLDTSLPVLNYIEQHYLYYVDRLGRYLDETRLKHSFSVARLAYQIAASNGFSPEQAYLAGLLHDIGKNTLPAKRLAIMQEHYPSYLSYDSFLYHQFVGEYLAQTDFLISDLAITDAIRTHNTGAANLRPLQMIVYAADKIEPGRGFDSSRLIHGCIDDYYQGFIEVLSANKQFLLAKKKNIYNPLTQICFRKYLKE